MQYATVIELASFTRDALKTWHEDELEEFKAYIAANPGSGDLVPETGGFRKIRWSAQGRGKRGGARVIYYSVDRDMHASDRRVYLTLFYAKSEKTDLSQADKRNLRALSRELKQDSTKRGR